MSNRIRNLSVSFVITILSANAFAQMGTGRVVGSARDTQGNPISGARVVAVGEGKTFEALTDEKGSWAMIGFKSATYEFTVSADGFNPQAYTQAIKTRGRNPRMDFVLDEKVVTKNEGSLFGEANEFYEQGNYGEALKIYERELANDPTMYQVNLMIGNVHREMEMYDEAIGAFQKVLDEEPMHSGALVSVGDILVTQQKLDEAIVYFEKAIDQTTDELIPFNVAEIYFNKGNATKAIDYYKIATERKPDWADGHLKLAYAFLNTGDMEGATAAFEKVVEVDPDSPQGQIAQGALTALK